MNKRFRFFVLAMTLVLVLCSCGNKTEEFSYSKGIDNDGFYEGIKASDYVTLPDLAKHGITDEDIDEELEYLRNQEEYMKKNENTERAIKNLDTVNIDYVGYVDGVPFEGGDTQGMGTEVTIGVTSYIDGFLDQLIGHKAGDNFDINVTFPEVYGNADLAGKPAVFNITINKVYDFEAYELTDNFITGMFYDEYGVKTVDEFKKVIKSSFVFDYIIRNCEFKDELPSVIGDKFMARMKHELQLQADSYGMTLDQFVGTMYASYGMSNYDDYKQFYKDYYLNQAVQESLMLQAIAEKENIRVSDADLEELYANTKASYEGAGLEFKTEDMIKVYGEPYIKQMALYDKIQAYFGTL